MDPDSGSGHPDPAGYQNSGSGAPLVKTICRPSARVTCRLEVNRKRCGDGDELLYVGYARVNVRVFR